MSDADRCAACGQPLSAVGTLLDLCTACLLDVAVTAPSGHTDMESLLPHLGIVNALGEGPRATVYLARFAPPDEGFVAIKKLKSGVPHVPSDSSPAYSLLQLDHPRIAAVFDMGTDADGCPYVVSEYVPGSPITSYCNQHGLLPVDRVALVLQATEALQYVHAAGLAHLNLKPSNIVVPRGTTALKIIDFEVAMPCGVPFHPYRAPEQARAGTPDLRSDVYALGMLVIEVLADGATPSGGEPVGEIGRIATRTDPAERYQSVGDLAAALTDALLTSL